MIDQPTHQMKLVEYNTIASSFGCLSSKVSHMHKYILQKYGSDVNFNYDHSDLYMKHLRADEEMS